MYNRASPETAAMTKLRITRSEPGLESPGRYCWCPRTGLWDSLTWTAGSRALTAGWVRPLWAVKWRRRDTLWCTH